MEKALISYRTGKPRLFEKGKTLFLTCAYPPNPTASSYVNYKLLDQFDPQSFIVLSGKFIGSKGVNIVKGVRNIRIYVSLEFYSKRLHKLLSEIQRITLPLFIRYYIAIFKPERIIITYPDLYWLDIASKIVSKKGIPYLAYLHDTIIEGNSHSVNIGRAKSIQKRLSDSAYRIAVITEGMQRLYAQKYDLNTVLWQHIYSEKVFDIPSRKELRAHWSGDVYQINNRAVYRLSRALKELKIDMTISNGKSKELLNSFGIQEELIEKVFFPQRSEYLHYLRGSRFLLLGLNYPDECEMHEDELATIFSTKTCEYLGSGSLIIYHGPGNYFLAQFLKENQCGFVIETRDEEKITQQIQEIMDGGDSYLYMIENSQKALQRFNPETVVSKIIDAMR